MYRGASPIRRKTASKKLNVSAGILHHQRRWRNAISRKTLHIHIDRYLFTLFSQQLDTGKLGNILEHLGEPVSISLELIIPLILRLQSYKHRSEVRKVIKNNYRQHTGRQLCLVSVQFQPDFGPGFGLFGSWDVNIHIYIAHTVLADYSGAFADDFLHGEKLFLHRLRHFFHHLVHIRSGICHSDEALFDFEGREFVLVHSHKAVCTHNDEYREEEQDYILVFHRTHNGA